MPDFEPISEESLNSLSLEQLRKIATEYMARAVELTEYAERLRDLAMKAARLANGREHGE